MSFARKILFALVLTAIVAPTTLSYARDAEDISESSCGSAGSARHAKDADDSDVDPDTTPAKKSGTALAPDSRIKTDVKLDVEAGGPPGTS